MKQRQGAASQWASKNPVLAAGEFGYDTTNDVVKIGDGKTAWSSLPSFRKKKYDLDSMSWSEISQIARAGRAPMLFNIGDEKTITLSTGEKITLVILDFWHDYYYDADNDEDVPAGITFGLKNCLATRKQHKCWRLGAKQNAHKCYGNAFVAVAERLAKRHYRS